MLQHYFCILLFISGFSLFSQDLQEENYTHQVAVLVENDVFTSLYRDQYYSSGLFGTYSWLKQDHEDLKVIRSASLVQRMFTPQFVSLNDVNDFDRPYAGHLSFQIKNSRYRRNQVLQHQLEIGWMGPKTLTGDIHVNWHNFLGLIEPRGWDFEIRDSPIINYHGTLTAKLAGNEVVELLSDSNVSLGTAFNFVRQEMIVRMGKLLPLLRSIQCNGQLGTQKTTSKSDITDEFVFFYGLSTEYNIYNSTIEGNLIGKKSPHVETPVDWILQHQVGFLFGWKGFDFTFRYYRRSKETTEATNHQYGGVLLARRF